MPLRDDRLGRRATIGSGKAPLRPDFSSAGTSMANKPGDTASSRSTPAAQANDVHNHDAISDGGPFEREAVSTEASSDVRGVERNGSSLVSAPVDALADTPSVVAQARSLLEPAAALMAVVRPFMRLRSAMMRFANLPIIESGSVSLHETANEETRAAVVVERSFANEIASLLQTPISEVVTSPSPAREAPLPFVPAAEPTAAESPAAQRRTESGTTEQVAIVDASSAGPPIERPVLDQANANARAGNGNDTSRIDAPTTADSLPRDWLELDEPAERSTFRNGVGESRDDVIDDSKRDGVVAEQRPEQNIVVARVPSRFERAVPITRLPLRPQGFDITWMAEVPQFERAGPLSRTARHELLERLARDPGTVSSDTIGRAYRQEEGEGRVIALRVLLRNFPQAGRSAFVEALRVGSDEERALAVDGLTAIDAREEMTPALCDRVDAIAAKAALSYVGTLERADYRAKLSPFVDETRIEAILNLLAGIVE